MKVASESAILKLKATEAGMNENFIVELSKPSKEQNNYIVFTISDGSSKFKGSIDVSNPANNIKTIMERRKMTSLKVRITEHITHEEDNEPSCIEILRFEIIDDRPKTERKSNKRVLKVTPEINLYEDDDFSFITKTFPQSKPEIKPLQELIRENLQESVKNVMTQPKEEMKKASQDSQETCAQKIVSYASQHQKIVDLYESYYNWTLVVKVTDITYKEFISKMGKETKILTIDLIDEDGFTIAANYFGQLAVSKQKLVKIGQTYQISKGRVAQDKYNRIKKEKSSRFTLVFTKDTILQETVDHPNISLASSNWMRLSDIPRCEQPNNFVGILVQIQSPREIEKEDKTIVMQSLKIADPVTAYVNEVIIWNNQIAVNTDLLNKSVLIKKFKPTKYRQQFSLNSTYKSQIVLHDFFAAQEGKYTFNSKGKVAEPKTIRRLSDQLHFLDMTATVTSTLDVWVKEIGFDKKWFYDACPNPRCKKACTNNTTNRCQHCLFQFLECNKKFILQVKLMDLTGSIEVTSFDQSAYVFLKNMSMEALFPMTNKELCVFSQSMFCYEEYRVQVTSKPDTMGRIKHTVTGKPAKISIGEAVRSNLRMIHSLASELNRQSDH